MRIKYQTKGYILIVVVCLIVLLGVFIAAALRFNFFAQQQVSLSLLSEKARLAAQSGLEIAYAQYRKDPVHCPAQTIAFDRQFGALEGFEVTISCDRNPFNSSKTAQLSHFYLKSKAVYQSNTAQPLPITYEATRWIERS